eukprot:2594641-Rhodomonas_salina.3
MLRPSTTSVSSVGSCCWLAPSLSLGGAGHVVLHEPRQVQLDERTTAPALALVLPPQRLSALLVREAGARAVAPWLAPALLLPRPPRHAADQAEGRPAALPPHHHDVHASVRRSSLPAGFWHAGHGTDCPRVSACCTHSRAPSTRLCCSSVCPARIACCAQIRDGHAASVDRELCVSVGVLEGRGHGEGGPASSARVLVAGHCSRLGRGASDSEGRGRAYWQSSRSAPPSWAPSRSRSRLLPQSLSKCGPLRSVPVGA